MFVNFNWMIIKKKRRGLNGKRINSSNINAYNRWKPSIWGLGLLLIENEINNVYLLIANEKDKLLDKSISKNRTDCRRQQSIQKKINF